LTFFQRIVPETGEIAHDFTDPSWNSRFLGDLYQDLSESARKKFALLQTPEFVEEFILDRTLTPAIETFGYQEMRLIDPTCGSGHFLLGAFHRLFALHQKHAPAANPRDLAQRALAQVAGVDLNPFAVAVARFRLLLAALKVSGITRLADAPAFHMHLAVGDSLLHGKRFGLATKGLQPTLVGTDPLRHVYEAEDLDALTAALGRQYHAVVGNPPYITVKDKAVNEAYRKGYGSCHRQYSLGVPFTERFFELAIPGDASAPAGFVGMIAANSFMAHRGFVWVGEGGRERGSRLWERLAARLSGG
jgi:Eco57I restriction-modification methylase